jgi:D-alanine-D-alanine ligase
VAPIARVLGARCFGCGVQAQALAQDKAKSGAVAAALGVRVPPSGVVQDGEWLSRPPADAGPWFVKPATLGAKIGIWPDSRVESLADALDLARRIRDRYRDDAVVQPFLPGWDARVSYMAVEPDPRFERLGAYRLDTLGEGEAGGAFVTLEDSRSLVGQRPDGAVSATLLDMRTSEPAINAAIVSMARTLARGIGLQDVFSLDIRLGEDGTPWFLEFEVSPAVTIYDFKRYLSDHWEMDLSGAIVRAFTRLLARPQVL